MNQEILAPALTREQARKLTDQVKADAAALWTRVLELYERGAHQALGYSSWRSYWETEFGGDGSRGDQFVRAGRVIRQLGSGDNCPLPANEGVARELVPLLGRPELEQVWRGAVELAEGQPTARQVRELVAAVPRAEGEPEPAEPAAAGVRALGQAQKAVSNAVQGCWGLSLGLQHADMTAISQLELDPEEVEQWETTLREARTWITRLLTALSRSE